MSTALESTAPDDERVPVAAVRVEARHRVDMGDIDGLAESIGEIGLINPITVTHDLRLIAGGRRLAAFRLLGKTHIPARVVDQFDDARNALLAERDENTCRKEMTVSEKVALGLALEELERPKARERQERTQLAGRTESGATAFGSGPGTGTEASAADGEVRSIVGGAVGMSGASYGRARRIVAAASNDALPDEVREVAREMVDAVDKGEIGIRTADSRIREAREKASRPERPPAPPRYGGNRRKHLAQIEAIVIGLNAYSMLADEMESSGLDGSVTSEEAARLGNGLSEAIRAIRRINHLLKERTK